MIQIIREFFLFRRTLRDYQMIELEDAEKKKLEAFDKSILKALQSRAYQNLVKEMLNENISKDYTLWYKHRIEHFISYFRKYN